MKKNNNKTPPKEQNNFLVTNAKEIETCELPQKEFKIPILWKTENLDMKNIINESKNATETFNSRLNLTEEKLYELEDRYLEITQSEEKKEIRMKKSEENLHGLWDTIKRNYICIMEVPEGREGKRVRKLTLKNLIRPSRYRKLSNSKKKKNSTQRDLH